MAQAPWTLIVKPATGDVTSGCRDRRWSSLGADVPDGALIASVPSSRDRRHSWWALVTLWNLSQLVARV